MHESARVRIDSILQRVLELEDDARQHFLDDACNPSTLNVFSNRE